MRDDLAIATMTLAKPGAEEQRMRRSLGLLNGLDIPIYVTDGGSPASFVDWLQRLSNVHVQPQQYGLVPQIRTSLKAAQAADWILYTEPDKAEFFEHGLASFVGRLGCHPDARLMLPARDAASFATFPEGQQIVEQCFNTLTAQLLGTTHTDTLYGPLLIHRSRLACLNAIPDDAGWGWRISVYAQAHLDGAPVITHDGYFPCPEEQRGEDDAAGRAYRLKQMQQNVRALQHALERIP